MVRLPSTAAQFSAPRSVRRLLRRRLVALAQIGIVGGKALEIVFALRRSARSLASVEIERPRAGIDVASQEGRAQLALAEDPVLIGLGNGRVPRMKGASHRTVLPGCESMAGRVRFSARCRFRLGWGRASVKLATWASAWTPASVRPEP